MTSALKPHIQIKKDWFDNDIIRLIVEICDGTSLFSNWVWIGSHGIEELVRDLNVFKNQIHGGIYDINFGNFGPEFAGGGFQARLHFYPPGKGQVYISTYQQSDYADFKKSEVASEARMYLKTEPGLLNRFIAELGSLNAGNSQDANMECLTLK
jgi:hypothetical protein